MPPARRAGRYDSQVSTSFIVRTNLRRLREMRGLTQDQAIARLEPPRLTASILGKIENGDRAITIEELVQLSVSYQVPIQAIVTPWEPLGIEKRPLLSGADRNSSEENIQEWLLHGKYPTYPGVITRGGSSLEGTTSTLIFSDPTALNELAKSPTAETYQRLTKEALKQVLDPIEVAITSFIDEVSKWIGFDPFTYFEDFEDNSQSLWPPDLEEQLFAADLPNTAKKLESLKQAHNDVKNLLHEAKNGLLTDLYYTTPEFPTGAEEWVESQAIRLANWTQIELAIEHAIKNQ